MNGNTRTGGGAVSTVPGPNWKAIGTGDFNGDGDSDILFQNTSTSQVSIWEMNGNTRIGGSAVSTVPGPNWKAIGTGDFNGDGLSDILFQNTSTSQVSIWEMNGNSRIGGGAVEPHSRAELESGRSGGFQRRRPFRHPVAEHDQRPGLDLGNEREYLDRPWGGQPQYRVELESGRFLKSDPER